MSIPSNPAFEAFLRGLRVTSAPGFSGYEVREILPQRLLRDHRGAMAAMAPLRLWYRPCGDLTLDALVRRVSAELKKLGHVDGERVALLVLALFSARYEGVSESVVRLNELLVQAVDGSVTQYWTTRLPAPGFKLEIPPYRLGEINLQRLNYWCSRVKSDFADRYSEDLKASHFGVEREALTTRVVDWFVKELQPWADWPQLRRDAYTLLLDEYFLALAEHYREAFWAELEAAQTLPTALDGAYLDLQNLRTHAGGLEICLFSGIGQRNWGHVTPVGVGVAFNFGGADKRIAGCLESIKRDYGESDAGASELSVATQRYGHFLARAVRHQLQGRGDESFLSLVIALDLLLGEKEASTSSVVTRGAVLTYRVAGRPFKDQQLLVRDLYDARSKYVHRGISPSAGKCEAVLEICREVLRCLLRLRGQSAARSEGFVERWLKMLDFVAAARLAGEEVSAERLRELGIS